MWAAPAERQLFLSILPPWSPGVGQVWVQGEGRYEERNQNLEKAVEMKPAEQAEE